MSLQYHTGCIRREDGSEYGIAGMETQVYIRNDNEWFAGLRSIKQKAD